MQNVPAYYRIRLNPPPSGPRAFSNRKENYRWEYQPDPNLGMCEIIFLQEGSISESRPDGERTYAQGTVHAMAHDRNCRQYSKDPLIHEFVLVFHLSVPFEPLTEEVVAQWKASAHEAILPEYITDPAACEKLGSMIKNAVAITKSDALTKDMKLRELLYGCLAILTEQAVLQARQRQQLPEYRRSRTTEKACQYIREHLEERLQVQEIARAVGVRYHHMSRVFHQEMHMTLVEYITRAKLRRVEQLITVEGMTLAEAGAAVGIPEPKYLSRLFRRYVGLTVREYRQIYKDRSNSGQS